MFPILSLFGEELTQNILQVLITGGAVMVGIEGLKNLPGIGEVFERYPKIAILANALGSLAVGLGACLVLHDTIVSVMCIVAAGGTFVAAAGWHLVKKAVAQQA